MSYRVLIADDAAFIREVLGHLLRKGGFDVVGEAADGKEAVQLALDLRPQLIVMDIIMPNMSGVQAAKEILQTLPETKIVACSTEGSENMVYRAMEAGCCDFIVKPFKSEEVVSQLKKCLEPQGGEQ